MKHLISVLKYGLIILTTAAVTVLGMTFGGANDVSYLRGLIRKYYVDDVEKSVLTDGEKAGMLAALGDSHTYYIPPEYGYDFFEDEVMGEFSGIGVTINKPKDSDYVTVSEVMPDLPAYNAGIKNGDAIIKVDGEDTKGKSVNDVALLVRGKIGTSVNITVERDAEELEFSVKREKISAESVHSKVLDGNIGYVYISQFDNDTDAELKEAVSKLPDVKGLVIDLRDNPGGIMQVAISSLDLFLDKGDVIVTAKYKDSEKTYKSDHKKTFDMPVTVLVNENSASASEIFSAAIKENGRGKIVGTTTYGKGSIQKTFMLGDNSGANITIGRFYSPKNNKIDKVGVKPDVEVELPDELKDTAISSLEFEKDTQLKEAVKQF